MRLHIILALITAILVFFSLRYTRPYKFTYSTVVNLAEALSKHPYASSPRIAPEALQRLSYDQYNDIRWKKSARLWQNLALPFQVEFWHLGGIYKKPVEISTVGRRGVTRLVYSPRFFDYGSNRFDPPLPTDLGYAGFRILYPLNGNPWLDEIGSFLGASYFRIIGKGQWYGLSARGLSIDTMVIGAKSGQMEPEEFPDFTNYWLVQPTGASEIDLYALLQSPSVTGAYSFKIHPGDSTVVDITATLFIRKKVKRFGIAPLTSMYLFGENSRDWVKDTHEDNLHPEIHDSDGVLINNGAGEWLWRPLQSDLHDVHRSGIAHTLEEARMIAAEINFPLIVRPAFTLGGTGGGIAYNKREFEEIVKRGFDLSPVSEVLIEESDHQLHGALQEYHFLDDNPKGFGLLQRDRDYSHYADSEANYHRRPSCWVRPGENWGKGSVTLLQLPSTDVNTDDVSLMWCPQQIPEPGQRLQVSYSLTFFSENPDLPPLAYVKQTLTNLPPPEPLLPPIRHPSASELRIEPLEVPPLTASAVIPGPPAPEEKRLPQIVLDFVGPNLNVPDNNAVGMKTPIPYPLITSTPPNRVKRVHIAPNSEDKSWRVTFDIQAQPGDRNIDLRGTLMQNDKPLSETWTYAFLIHPPGKD